MKTKIYKFKNGATLIYKKIKSLKMTACESGFLAGTRYRDGIDGLPHFFEHMLFKQTENRSEDQIIEDKVNITPLNAYTNRDLIMTTFAESNRKIEKCFEYASDVLLNSKFDQKFISDEINVVLEERAQKENKLKSDFLYQCYKSVFDTDTDYENTLGNIQSLSKINVEVLENFREKNFVADKFFVTVATGLGFHKIKRLVKKYFINKLKVSSSPSEILEIKTDTIKEKQNLSIIDWKTAFNVRLYFTFNCEIDEFRFDYTPDFLCYLISRNKGLFYHMARKKGLIYSAGINYDIENFAKRNSIFFSFTTSSFENIEKIFKLISKTIRQLKKNGVSQEDIDLWRENKFIEADYEKFLSCKKIAYDNIQKYLKRKEIIKITEKQYKKHINSVKKDKVEQFIKRVFNKKNNIHIVMMGELENCNVKTIDEYKDILYK